MTTETPDTAPQKRTRIVFLDYMRIYACLGVLECHIFKSANEITFSESTWFTNAFAAAYHFIMRSLTEGGVVGFFLVSGYIIAYVIERESTGIFLVRRVFRIYPAYIAAIVAQFYFTSHSIPGWHALLPRFSLLGDFTGTPQVLNGVDWTLRIEVVFYAFIALLSCIKIARHPFLIKVGILPFVALGVFLMPSFPPSIPGVFNQFFPFLLLGMSFYYVEIKKAPIIYCLAMMVFVFCGYIWRYKDGQLPTLGYLVPVLIFAAMWVYRERITGGGKLVSFAARVTYTVYLFHNWYINYAEDLLASHGVSQTLSEVLALASLLGLCYAVNLVIEQPFINLGKWITHRYAGLLGAKPQLARTVARRLFSSPRRL